MSLLLCLSPSIPLTLDDLAGAEGKDEGVATVFFFEFWFFESE